MTKTRKALAAAAVIILIAAVVLLWPRDEVVAPAPPPPKAREVRRARAAPPSPAAPEEDRREALERELEEAGFRSLGPLDTGEQEAALVTIRAEYPDGSPVREPLLVQSRACRVWKSVDEGPTIQFQTREPSCTVRVGRPDGRLYAWSAPLEVDLSGGDLALRVVLPEEETGGLGIAFSAAEEGMRVEQVWPGSPADAFGLEEGDVILEVDGLPTDALDEDEFVEVMTGPVGTAVDFVVGFETDTGWVEEELTLSRQRIE